MTPTRLAAAAIFSLFGCLGCAAPHTPEPPAASVPAAAPSARRASLDPDPCALPDNSVHPERPPIQALPFRIEDLPVTLRSPFEGVSLEKLRDDAAGGPAAAPPPELGLRVVPLLFPRAHASRAVELALTSRYGFTNMPTPAIFDCDEPASLVLVHFAAITPDRSLPRALRKPADYVEGDAWMDPLRCRLSLARSIHVKAMPIAAGVLFGVREAQAAGDPPDRLSLFMPRTKAVSFQGWGAEPAVEPHGELTRVSLPLEKGGGGLLTVTFSAIELDEWLAGGKPDEADAGARLETLGTELVTINVEVTQTITDPEPIGLAYFEKSGTWQTLARTRLFDCPVQ